MLKKHLMIALAFLFMAGFAACETDHNDEMTETNEMVVTEDNDTVATDDNDDMVDHDEEIAEADDEDRTAGEVLDDTVITSVIKTELLADSDVSGLDMTSTPWKDL